MRRIAPRLTTRRLLVAVALVALLLAAGRHARRWSRWAQAERRYAAMRAFYDEGRVTIDRMAESSRQLMDAEQAMRPTVVSRVAAFDAHLARLTDFAKVERGQLQFQYCRGRSMMEREIEEVEAAIGVARAARDRLAGWSR